MPPQTAKSLMKEFRASFRRKKVVVDQAAKVANNAANEEKDEELAKLQEMKENLRDQIPPIYDDSDLLSFLRARSLNVKEAEKLLKLDENVKRIMRIHEYRVPVDKKDYNISCLIGVDKEGSLVRLTNLGYADAKGLVSMMSTIDALKLLICMVEHDMLLQEQENRKSGRKCKQIVYLVNLENLSMSQVGYKPAFDLIMQILKLLQDHYHDVLKMVYIVNAPPFFASVFKLVKPVIQDSLQSKIKIFDNDSGKGELLKRIDASVLPEYLGGNRVDSHGDPRCAEFVCFGGSVPESHYLTNFLDPEGDPDVVCATVPAGATLNFRFPVRQLGSVLRWHLQAKDNDIGVGLFREPFHSTGSSEGPRSSFRRGSKKEEDVSKFEQLTPVIRSQCHLAPEQGSTILWFTGNIILHFDNSYSWMNSKEVYFKVSVAPPTETEKNYLNSVDKATRGLRKMDIGASTLN